MPALHNATMHRLSRSAVYQTCQQNADQLFLLALTVPLAVAVVAIVWILRQPQAADTDSEEVFQDPETGNYFKGDLPPERDRKGELAWRAISYTPWPVEEGTAGERMRVDVGPVGERQPRTFVFDKKLRQPSQLIAVTLDRPLGVMFEEDRRRAMVRVWDVADGSRAAQRAKLAQFDRAARARAALPGDLLRAVTATTISYPAQSLVLGAQAPKRYVVLYGADDQRWERVATALKRGLSEDGPVTLVLERELPRDNAE